MENYVAPLWMLLISRLLGGVADLMPEGTLTLIVNLCGTILGIVAAVKLASRNEHMRKMKNCLIALFITLAVMIVSAFILRSGFAAFVMIAGLIAMVVIALISSYYELYGLADMAEEAGEQPHARALRGLFTANITVIILSTVIRLITESLNTVLAVASIALLLGRLYLLFRSILIEKKYAARVKIEQDMHQNKEDSPWKTI